MTRQKAAVKILKWKLPNSDEQKAFEREVDILRNL
jgi:hypothetical protein